MKAMPHKQTSKEILIQIMYNGDYLQYSNNIGYEIINLFESDQGNHYIYVLPYGTYASKHTDRIQHILLTRKLDKLPILEILGKASELEKIYNTQKTKEEDIRKQSDLSNEITYGGVCLQDIFRDSAYQDYYVTFKANNVVRPKEKLYLIYNKDNQKQCIQPNDGKIIQIKNTHLPKEAQKQYFEEGDDDYTRIIDEIINCPNLWNTTDSIKKVEIPLQAKTIEPNLFDICGISDRELAFSNTLAYFISKYPELLVEFALEYNETITLFKNKGLQVIREKESNIDILIKTASHIIVVENKIRSGINGIDSREDKRFNQLKKYQDYINDKYQKDEREKLFIILKPDYNNIDLSKYQPKKHYIELSYKKIYTFLSSKLSQQPYNKDRYLKEFHSALFKHTQEIYEDKFQTMKRKFEQIILQRRTENK